MESVLCVTWGLGAWSSAVSTTQSQFVCSRILFHGVIYEINCTNLCSQWMISAACHSSFCTVTLRNRWMSTPSAGWSFYLSSGTLLYTEMLLGWTGEDSTLDANTAWHKRKSCDTYYQLLRCRNSVCGWKTQSFSLLYFLFFFFLPLLLHKMTNNAFVCHQVFSDFLSEPLGYILCRYLSVCFFSL